MAGSIEFELEMAEITKDFTLGFSNVTIGGWDPTNKNPSAKVALEYYYTDT